MGAKKALLIAAVVVALLLVGSGIAVFALSRSEPLAPYHSGVDPQARDLQTRLAVALVASGIESPLVIVRDGSALAMYELPATDERDADGWQRVVLGALASLASEQATTLVARQFVDGNASIEWSVPTAKVLAYEGGTLSASELDAAVTRKTF